MNGFHFIGGVTLSVGHCEGSKAGRPLPKKERSGGLDMVSQFASKYEDYFRVLVPSAVHVGATWDFEVDGVPFEVKGVDVDSRSNGSYFTITHHQKEAIKGMYAFLVLSGDDLRVYFVESKVIHPLLSSCPYCYRYLFYFQFPLSSLRSLAPRKKRIVVIRDFLTMYKEKKETERNEDQ